MRPLIVVLLLGLATPTQAATWRVEKDGSGDYAEIQAAIDNTAPRDTVLVGPGRYDETIAHQFPEGTLHAVAVIKDWPLTLLGADSALVFLGPPHPDSLVVPEPVGVYIRGTVTSGTNIKGLTVENLYDGVLASASVTTVRGCAFRGNEQAGIVGIDIVDAEGMTVKNCSLERCEYGVLGIQSRGIRTINCFFLDHRQAVEYSTVLDGLVEYCSFISGWGGVQMDQGATGVIRGCEFVGVTRNPISVIQQVTVQLVDNHVGEGSWNSLWVQSLSHVEGEGNRFGAGSTATAFFSGNATANLSGSSFQHGAGWTVLLDSYLDGMPSQLNLAGNWWGTTDADSIDAWIWDGNDDPAIKAVVEYEPFLKKPLPARQTSFSEFKSLFSNEK